MNNNGANSLEIKQMNRNKIYNYIRKNQPVSKRDIVYGLRLSLPTVTQNLEYLMEQKLIDASHKIKYTGGRNAIAYTCLENAKIGIGMDITGNHVKAVAVDLLGEVMKVIVKRVKFELTDGYYKKLGEMVRELIVQVDIDDAQVLGVGIAVPGLVSEDGEVVTYGLTLDFTGATREEFAKYIPYPNKLFHDSYTAGYAEIRSEPEMKDAFYISLSNNVGGSIIMNNKIYFGDSNKSGEIGHMIIQPNGVPCYCGQRGCFETYCNARELSNETDGDLEKFFQLLDAREESIVKVWDQYLDYLGIAIHNIRLLFDCTVIIGGYVGSYIDNYMDELLKRIDALHPFSEAATDYIIPCKYKTEAIAAGAALMYVDAFTKNI
ncbi:MAG: ROK family protein [Lachnospiraceae bacterium]